MDVADCSIWPVSRIKTAVESLSVDSYPEWIGILSTDPRKSVQALVQKLQRQQARLEKATAKTNQMLKMERQLHDDGYEIICGIDEVGRGPLAGPVVCASVIMRTDSALLYVDDSKKLTSKRREELACNIKSEAISWKIGIQPPEVIDSINILEATKCAMLESVDALDIQPDLLLIDAVQLPSHIPVKSIIKGDATCYSIAAASILAKVYRDELMVEYHVKYPQYGFDHNMGYGTEEHIKALKKYGPTPIHRRSFIKNFL